MKFSMEKIAGDLFLGLRVIRGKLLLSIQSQLYEVQYGEISRLSLWQMGDLFLGLRVMSRSKLLLSINGQLYNVVLFSREKNAK